ncbi:myelin regulatory factor isoform X2 [Bacillus rossius redtenbacheri]|uniref:myelin regulatory factor isoform X2 n=1 Tax=Bacillus rossius redtenbacheri TaxID=93214 RepID=UPI002FDD7E53
MEYPWPLAPGGARDGEDSRRLAPDRAPDGGRNDFVGGIDNEALDFSQLEDFINDENEGNNTYFASTLAHEAARGQAASATLAPAAVEVGGAQAVLGQTAPGYTAPHNLPESPPDSGSEPPYSPPDGSSQPSHQKGPGRAASVHAELLVPRHPHQVLYHQISSPHDAALLAQHPVLTPLLTQAQAGLSPGGSRLGAPEPSMPSLGLVSSQPTLSLGLSSEHQQGLVTLYSSLQNAPSNSISLCGSKKRKLSDDGESPQIVSHFIGTSSSAVSNTVHVKQEPANVEEKRENQSALKKDDAVCYLPGEFGSFSVTDLSPDSNSNQTAVLDDDYSFDIPGESNLYLDSNYQCIRFQPFQQTAWHVLCDQNLKDLSVPFYKVDADKGFNFSNADDAFVCQKKNHFQITCHAQLYGEPQFVKTPEGLKKITGFHLHFYGVKVESPSQTIKVEQSQSDRSKKPFHPVPVVCVCSMDIRSEQVTKLTVGRLHFSETTSNNMRKKGKPNPDQRYFYLVVGLHAHCADNLDYPVVSHASERIIVRAFLFQASNPGQFESDVELCWQKGHTSDSIYHVGRVGINNDRPDESLVVHGNVKVTGHIVHPSDQRAKEIIQECDSEQQLRNVRSLRLVQFHYLPEFALQAGLPGLALDTGVVAQQVQQVLPDAVHSAGDVVLPSGQRIHDLLLVNKDRLFMENVGAVKELGRLTDGLVTRVGKLEKINRKIVKCIRLDSVRSTTSISTVSSKSSMSSCKRHRRHRCCNSSHSTNDTKDRCFCSFKFIYIAIGLLLLTMAFCLMALTALHFLHMRKHTMICGNLFGRKEAALNASSSPHEDCAGCNGSSAEMSPSEPVPAAGLSAPAVGRPSACRAAPNLLDSADTACQAFCCQTNQIVHQPVDLTSTTFNKVVTGNELPQLQSQQGELSNTVLSSPETTAVNSEDGSKNSNKISLGNFDSYSSRTSSQPFNKQPVVWPKPHSVKKNTSRQRRETYNWSDQENLFGSAETSQDADYGGIVLTLQGQQFNQTLGPEFCALGSLEYSKCCDRTAHNYTFLIRLSKYMPDQALLLHFQFVRIAHIQTVEKCGQPEVAMECPWNKHKPNWTSVIENHQQEHSRALWTFHVHAGSFALFAQTYRIPLVHSDINACDLPPSKLGSEYLEYNLKFYRDCTE